MFLWGSLTGIAVQTDDNESVKNEIEKIFSEADHLSLGKMLASTVQLDLPKNTGQWSSTQAMYIVKKFFDDFPVKFFEVLQFGVNKSNNTYLAGTYTSETATFDVYIVFKEENNKLCIYKLNIREQ
jgi:hypothetical protein